MIDLFKYLLNTKSSLRYFKIHLLEVLFTNEFINWLTEYSLYSIKINLLKNNNKRQSIHHKLKAEVCYGTQLVIERENDRFDL